MSEGRYRIIRRIAEGEVAEVFEAWMQGAGGFERKVAIKRLLPALGASEAFVQAFRDEARIASELRHANIVSVLDFGVEDGRPFLALELVDGLDAQKLRAISVERSLAVPPAVALHVTTEIAHALDYAHKARGADGRPMKIVHRDVCPANILISWQGDVKLADFGIARAVRRVERTHGGPTKGSLGFIAPEQREGGRVDGRADVFSLGCALHAFLVGRSPLVEDPQGARLVIDPALDLDVAEIVRRSTALFPDDRYPDAHTMAAAAGTALARRLTRDARSALRTWLLDLTEAETAAIDEGVDLRFVLQDTPSAGSPEYESFNGPNDRDTLVDRIDPRPTRPFSELTQLEEPSDRFQSPATSAADLVTDADPYSVTFKRDRPAELGELAARPRETLDGDSASLDAPSAGTPQPFGRTRLTEPRGAGGSEASGPTPAPATGARAHVDEARRPAQGAPRPTAWVAILSLGLIFLASAAITVALSLEHPPAASRAGRLDERLARIPARVAALSTVSPSARAALEQRCAALRGRLTTADPTALEVEVGALEADLARLEVTRPE